MRRHALLISIALLVPAPGALADGGPDPGVLQGGAGIANTNGNVRYVALPADELTTLAAIATHGGQIIDSTLVRGRWGVPAIDYGGGVGGLSTNGRTLVLGRNNFGTCTPSGCSPLRTETSFLVLNPKTLRRHTTLTLRGDFAFDALSPDGRRLYLIEHTSTTNLNKYVVRAYDLAARRLLPGTIADRSQRGWIMQGIPMARATSSDGRYVYTLYANTGGYPFVHALDSVAGTAHCIGIPETNEQIAGDLNLLTLSRDGRELTIGQTMPTGRVLDFRLDTSSYRVTPVVSPAPRRGFPWWTLSLLALVLPPAFLLARKRAGRRALRSEPDAMPGSA